MTKNEEIDYMSRAQRWSGHLSVLERESKTNLETEIGRVKGYLNFKRYKAIVEEVETIAYLKTHITAYSELIKNLSIIFENEENIINETYDSETKNALNLIYSVVNLINTMNQNVNPLIFPFLQSKKLKLIELKNYYQITFGDKKLTPVEIINQAKALQNELECKNNEIMNQFTTQSYFAQTLLKTGDIVPVKRGRQPSVYVRDDKAKETELSRLLLIPKTFEKLKEGIHKTLKIDLEIEIMQTVHSEEITSMKDIRDGMTIFVTFKKVKRSIYTPVQMNVPTRDGFERRKVFGANKDILSMYKNANKKYYGEKETNDKQTQVKNKPKEYNQKTAVMSKLKTKINPIPVYPDTRVTTHGLHPSKRDPKYYPMAECKTKRFVLGPSATPSEAPSTTTEVSSSASTTTEDNISHHENDVMNDMTLDIPSPQAKGQNQSVVYTSIIASDGEEEFTREGLSDNELVVIVDEETIKQEGFDELEQQRREVDMKIEALKANSPRNDEQNVFSTTQESSTDNQDNNNIDELEQQKNTLDDKIAKLKASNREYSDKLQKMQSDSNNTSSSQEGTDTNTVSNTSSRINEEEEEEERNENKENTNEQKEERIPNNQHIIQEEDLTNSQQLIEEEEEEVHENIENNSETQNVNQNIEEEEEEEVAENVINNIETQNDNKNIEEEEEEEEKQEVLEVTSSPNKDDNQNIEEEEEEEENVELNSSSKHTKSSLSTNETSVYVYEEDEEESPNSPPPKGEEGGAEITLKKKERPKAKTSSTSEDEDVGVWLKNESSDSYTDFLNNEEIAKMDV